MGERIYQVIYIDKFANPEEAQASYQQIQDTFQLSEQAIRQLQSQKPVPIKQNTNRETAQTICELMNSLGATCWLQEMSADEAFFDRREEKRRQQFDRRQHYRSSSIQPDRRHDCGRRSTDIN